MFQGGGGVLLEGNGTIQHQSTDCLLIFHQVPLHTNQDVLLLLRLR